MTRERGQASILLVGGLAGVLIGALMLGAVARAVGEEGAAQRAADLGALAGARAMHAAYPRLFEPVRFADRPNPAHLDRAAYLRLGRAAAERVARANGADAVAVAFPDGDSFAPVRVGVSVRERVEVGRGRVRRRRARRRRGGGRARAARRRRPRRRRRLRRPAGVSPGQADAPRRRAGVRPHGARGAGGRRHAADHQRLPLRRRAGGPLPPPPRPALGRAAGPVAAPLRHRARPRPRAAYAWLAANAERFHFMQRYSWEPWHFGYTPNARRDGGAARAGRGRRTATGRRGAARCPGFVPDRYAPILARAAQRWNVSAALLAAQLYAESNFNPFAVSPAGAQGIAQFMPGTAAALGLEDPFDADAGDRRPGAPDARPAAPLRVRPARARGLQRRPGAGRGLRLRAAVSRRPAATSRASSGCSAAPARPSPARGLTVRLVR